MKVKHRNKNKVLLKPLNVSKRREALLRSYRSYRNYKKFGLRDKGAMKKRLKMKGRGPVQTGGNKSYVTDNDRAWIKKLNPYDKLIANKSIKVLDGISKLVGKFDPSLKNEDMAEQVKKLSQLKSTIIQQALGYEGQGFGGNVGNALKNTFKDIGLTLVGKGWLWESGQEKLESVTERKQRLSAALDDLLNQARNKGQEAMSQLNQLYLKQGDREEQKQIRDEEEKKQDEKNEALRKREKLENLPEYQSIDEVNPLGYSSGRRYLKVDPENQSQVRAVRNNPMLREQDTSYISNNRNLKSVSFDAHKKPPVVVNNDVHRQKVAEQALQKKQNQQLPTNSSW